MARTKTEKAEWENHRGELKSLWLDQRWTAGQIRDYMSQRHGFCKSEHQYTRQFKNWGFKKNSTDEMWQFVASRREKRKRDGKDSGAVWMNGKIIPEQKVRKEISRHVPLSSQCLAIGNSDPKTPEGVVIGTPRSEMDVEVPDAPANVLAMDWCQDVNVDAMNLGASTLFQSAGEDPLAFQTEFSGTNLLDSYFQGNEEPAAASSNLGGATLEYCLPIPTSADTPAFADRNDRIQYSPDSMSNDIVEAARLTLLRQSRTFGDYNNHSDLVSALEPITIGDVNNDLTRRAETIFQSPGPENLSHYLNLCVYLSSNNLMSQQSTDRLVSLITKSRFHSRLKTFFQSRTTTIEIFMSNLLASAAAVGDVAVCRMLIEAGADLDATSGLGIRTTALHRALMNNNTVCARMLLEAGADPNLAIEGETPLHTACFNSLDSVKLLVKFGAHVNPPQDCARLTPLQLAVEEHDFDMVQFLLNKKANPNLFTTSKSGTALQMACSHSDASIVELLIAAGADIDSRSGCRCENRNDDYLRSSDSESQSEEDQDECYSSDWGAIPNSSKPAILIAAQNENWEVVQLLLEEGAAVNPSFSKCQVKVLNQELADYLEQPAVFTPLKAAVRAQNITMARMLLSAGAHIDSRLRGKYGHTALQICAMVGNLRLIEILLRKGADINAPASAYCGRTALQAGAIHSDTKLLSLLLREGADIAVAAGNIEGVRILLDANAVVNTNPSLTEGVTALREAITIRDSAIRNEIIHILLRAGAYVAAPKCQESYAPLHAAVRKGDLEITRMLLEKGASPNVGYCTLERLTPLQQASAQGEEGLVRVLIDYGAEVNAPPFIVKGYTALQLAATCGHLSVVRMLLDLGAKVKPEKASTHRMSAIEGAVERCDQELVKLFLDIEPGVISSDPKAKNRIIGVALDSWKCDVPLLELLLKGGANVDPPCRPTKMPFLQKAAQRDDFRMVQCLLSAGANVNHRWQTNFLGHVTPLQAAVSKRNIDIVQLLLERGADVNLPANKNGGKTALQIAVSQNYPVMVGLLVHHGADVNGLPSPIRGRTALQEAACSGFVKLTQHLMAHGADVNAPAAQFGGVTALQGAAIQGNIRIVMTLLLAGADINGAPAIEQGRNAIEGAAENGRLDTLHLLLNCHPDTEEFEIRKKRAAKLALANGHLAIGRFLMAYRKFAWKG